jgi:hypothetical protein
MTRYLLFCLLLASFTGASVRGAEPSSENSAYLMNVGLVADEPAAPAADKALKRTAGATAVKAHQLGVSLDTRE